MTDEWSLKDCKLYGGRGYFRGDIETLREKLLEDINKVTDISHFVEEPADDLIAIINKRFGV